MRSPFFDVTVTHSGREEHVLRLGHDELKAADEFRGIEDPPDHTGPGGMEKLERWLKERGVSLWGGGKGKGPGRGGAR